MREDIEQKYPRAKIEGLEKKPLIRIIDEVEDEGKKGESGTEKEKR
ncbi:MAG: hypothetical protein JSV75_00795 [Candidatus Bathyarchaeota archaeon]|nr:hypothetical protein [Candidatus Bathyarchaeota archaeon]UCD26696.1 MAG: hypothetical protein JSV75_00795 [Candidatus Bathyarchaeota archaeon]